MDDEIAIARGSVGRVMGKYFQILKSEAALAPGAHGSHRPSSDVRRLAAISVSGRPAPAHRTSGRGGMRRETRGRKQMTYPSTSVDERERWPVRSCALQSPR